MGQTAFALWAEDAVVEDPVGPSFFDPEGKGHHGIAGISAFWDIAIAPLSHASGAIAGALLCWLLPHVLPRQSSA